MKITCLSPQDSTESALPSLFVCGKGRSRVVLGSSYHSLVTVRLDVVVVAADSPNPIPSPPWLVFSCNRLM